MYFYKHIRKLQFGNLARYNLNLVVAYYYVYIIVPFFLTAKSQSEHLSNETVKTFFAALAKMLIDVLPTPTETSGPLTPPLIVVLMSVLGGILVLACIILVFLVAVVIAKSNKK